MCGTDHAFHADRLDAHVIKRHQWRAGGRYFLPFLPALLLICKNDRLILTKDINRSILYFMLVLNSYVLFRTFAAVVLRV